MRQAGKSIKIDFEDKKYEKKLKIKKQSIKINKAQWKLTFPSSSTHFSDILSRKGMGGVKSDLSPNLSFL